MSKQRIVKDEIWDDEWFFDLTPHQKLVWLFLLTNQRANIAGVYKMNLRWISVQIGLADNDVKNILEYFIECGKILWEDSWVGLINFHKHLPYSNPNTMKGIQRLHDEMKESTYPLKGFERLWVTLLNLTLLNSGESNDSPSKKKLNNKDMGWKPYNENSHSDDLPEMDLDSREVKKEEKKAKSTAPLIFQIFKEELGIHPLNWQVNKTERKCAENLYTERGEEQVRRALQFFLENKDEEFCPQINSPYDLDSKWKSLSNFKKKHE